MMTSLKTRPFLINTMTSFTESLNRKVMFDDVILCHLLIDFSKKFVSKEFMRKYIHVARGLKVTSF